MANSKFPQVTFTGLDDWQPWAGNSNAFVAREGFYEVKLDLLEPSETTSAYPQIKVGGVILDKDCDPEGAHIMANVIYGGVDQKGKPMVRQFASFLASTGTTVEQIQGFSKQNASFPIEGVLAKLADRNAYCELRYKTYKGQPQSPVANWVTKEVYEKKKEQNAHRGRAAAQVDWAAMAKLEVADGTKPGSAPGGAGAPGGGFTGGNLNLGGPAGGTDNGTVPTF